jgi:hypothetical protein
MFFEGWQGIYTLVGIVVVIGAALYWVAKKLK